MKKIKTTKVLGYLFVIPVLISIIPYTILCLVMFYNQVLARNFEGCRYMVIDDTIIINSQLPIYLGLMAISSAYLFRDRS